MANPMMASHGCGQRVGFGRLIGLAMLALGLNGVPGPASACHLHHRRATTDHTVGGATVNPGGPALVQSQQILTPASLVPQLPTLTPTTAPTITTTGTTVPTPAGSSTPLSPSPVANPPAAEAITPRAAAPAVSAWHDAGLPTIPANLGTSVLPIVLTPPAMPGLSAPAPLLPPLATATPEPSTIVSALAMIGAAAAWRRRVRVATSPR